MKDSKCTELKHICEVIINRTYKARDLALESKNVLFGTSAKYLQEPSIQENIEDAIGILQGIIDWYRGEKEIPEGVKQTVKEEEEYIKEDE